MENELLEQLLKYGGGVAIIVAITFLVKALSDLLKNRTNNNLDQRLQNVQKKVENEHEHEFVRVWAKLDTMQNEMSEISKSTEKRLARIESKLNIN